MKKSLLIYLPFLMLTLLFSLQLSGQKEIFKGLFDKEEPVLHSSIVPAAERGAVKMALHFTHPKTNSLEVSVWIKDRGTSLQADGSKVMVMGLREMGNRRVDTIRIEGLSDLHFYTIGIDYRNPKTLSRKFNSKVIQEAYRYEFSEKKPAPRPLKRTEEVVVNPCRDPEISVRIAPAGYCGPDKRPAVLVQCQNCRGESWKFGVEIRRETEYWRPLRVDGEYQAAFGDAVRTEPLCTLSPGAYYIRVSAWGNNCKSPVVFTTKELLLIREREPVSNSRELSAQIELVSPFPDTCMLAGQAILKGNMISGTLQLEANSPCSEWYPYAEVRYVHPGYRDITINRIFLTPGWGAPFNISLDDKDLARGIHTIHIAAFVRQKPMGEGVPLASFWIRAEENQNLVASRRIEEPYVENPVVKMEDFGKKGASEASPGELTGVKGIGAESNCTRIQELQLVFDPRKPEQPLFISWLSPSCCQEDGCVYSVWAGKTEAQLRLLIRGSKPGPTVRELLQDLKPDDAYFEVLVKTSNGMRKAAYVLGEGPRYGYEEVIVSHDEDNTRHSQSRKVEWEEPLYPPAGEPLVFKKGVAAAYKKPKLPIANFGPCQYQREMTITGDDPVHDGDRITIKYDYSEKGYKYTLYFLPEGFDEWVLAPGTKELQRTPTFALKANPSHSGKYLILAYNGKNWGCLSAPLSDPIEIEVVE